jgi:hypothetical protein
VIATRAERRNPDLSNDTLLNSSQQGLVRRGRIIARIELVQASAGIGHRVPGVQEKRIWEMFAGVVLAYQEVAGCKLRPATHE